MHWDDIEYDDLPFGVEPYSQEGKPPRGRWQRGRDQLAGTTTYTVDGVHVLTTDPNSFVHSRIHIIWATKQVLQVSTKLSRDGM